MPDQPPAPAQDAAITLTIDGVTVQAPKGTVLVDAAKSVGIEIPIFCYEPRLGSPIGACRMCLVEVEGMRGLQTACSTPVGPDMVVRTTTDEVKQAHDGVLELILANHPLDCPVCDKGGECPLQDRTFRFGPGATRFTEHKRNFPKPLDLSPLVALDRERCIQCYRCIRFSQDVAQDGQLTFQERGAHTEVATFTGEPYEGRFTGNIIDLCPVGALTSIPYRFVSRPWDVANTPSVCGHCPVGCNSELTMRDGEVKRVTGRFEPNFAVEEGWLCDKGRWAYPALWSEDRLTEPEIVDELGRRRVPVERAVGALAGRLLRPGARAAILVGPGATVEEGYLAHQIGRSLGAPVARLGRDDAVLDELRGLPGAQLGDLDRAKAVAVVGGAVPDQQPVVELRLRKARRLGARVISVGSRPTAVETLDLSIRSRPGRLVEGLAALAEQLHGAEGVIVCWDQADLADDPAAARATADLVRALGARQLELGHEVNGAGLRALGIPATGVLEAAERGEVDVLVLVQADPLSAAGATRWARALEGVRTVLTERAAVVVPLLTAYETEGVLVSMNGRAQRLRPGARGPEGAAGGWEVLVGLTHRLARPVPHRTAAHVFDAVAAACPPFAGMSYETLGAEGRPLSAPALCGGTPAEGAAAEGDGLVLIGTTGIFGDPDSHRSDALRVVRTGAACALAPADADRLGLADAARVRVSSPHGECVLPLRVDERLPEGAAFVTLGVPGAGAEALLPAGGGAVQVAVAAAPHEAEVAA
jgi:NADH-quinone oxidoreductase subunit G